MLTKFKNIPVRDYFDRSLKVVTSPEVILLFGVIGGLVKICHEINEFRKEHRRPIGFRK
jgi:hypothetical protein